jgi:hypothetical protein
MFSLLLLFFSVHELVFYFIYVKILYINWRRLILLMIVWKFTQNQL